jgi:hypothetical protein
MRSAEPNKTPTSNPPAYVPKLPETPKLERAPDVTGSVSEHRYLQQIVKRIAEKYGFIATLEMPVLGGTGRIDVTLENGDIKLACEIAVTNTPEYEVQNIQKCFGAGYDEVIVISVDANHLAEITDVAREALGAGKLEHVAFIKPERFHQHLESLLRIGSVTDTANKVKGYTVVSSHAETDIRTAESIKEAILEVIGSEADK